MIPDSSKMHPCDLAEELREWAEVLLRNRNKSAIDLEHSALLMTLAAEKLEAMGTTRA